MKKIIFINRYFYPDHSATSQLLTDLAFDLAAGKADIRVITSRQVYDNPDASLPVEEAINGVTIIRAWSSRFGRQKLWGRALDYLTFYLGAAWCLAAVVKPGDVVVAKTDPPMISVVAAVVARLRGANLVNWVQDMFPEVASALGVTVIRKVEPILKKLRNFSLSAARMNVVLGERMAARVVAQGVDASKVAVIHNWADGEDIRPIQHEQNALRSQWALQDKFVIGYSGNMGRAHEFETIIEIAERLGQDEQFMFLFIGGGAKKERLQQEVERRGLKNVMFKPYQPRSELIQSLGVPDVHVISLQPALEGLIVPSKFYGIAAAGRPTLYIGDQDGELARILAKEECGRAVEIGDADGAVIFLRALAADRTERERLGHNARVAFERRFDKKLALATWRRILEVGNAERTVTHQDAGERQNEKS